jgi:23S rRNA A1618 N6-methylase RlmF
LTATEIDEQSRDSAYLNIASNHLESGIFILARKTQDPLIEIEGFAFDKFV